MNAFRKSGGGRPPNRRGFSEAARAPFGGNAGNRGGKRAYGDHQEIAQKFDAVCSSCGKACQVPFRPNGKKPVYCKDCFDAPRKATPGGGRNFAANDNGGGGGKSIADLTRQIAAMNEKIDRMLEIIEGAGE
jgi:CxxC-x17-CxxC domain-containing protein